MSQVNIIDLVPKVVRQQWINDGTYPNQSVYTIFCQHAQKFPHKPAVLSLDETITYEQLLDKVNRLAQGLKILGISTGDVVAYQLCNSWRSCAIDLAVAALGAVVAPFPPGRGHLDIVSLLQRCHARAVIIEPKHGDTDLCQLITSFCSTLPNLQALIVDGPPRETWYTLSALLQSKPIISEQLPTVDPESPVRFLISSGTESEPKLVAYSHNALIGGRGRFLQHVHPEGDSFRGMYLVPLGSAFGSTATFGVLSWLGGSLILLPRFDVTSIIQAIQALRPTHILGVPTMFQRIAADPTLEQADRASLFAIISGGAMADPATVERCQAAFNCDFISLYGSADGVNCYTRFVAGDTTPNASCVGRPNPTVCAIRIVDDKGQEVAPGATGEITARGSITPMQYVNAPELDDKYRDAEGWVYTGDLGYIDKAGHLVLAGRKKEIIIRGGANISPIQIEDIATSHPDVVSASCVPVPDPDLGHRICLCLTTQEGCQRPSLPQMTRYLSEQGLEVNKLPEYLRYYRQLPLSPAGKVDKKQLAGEMLFLQTSNPINPMEGVAS